MGIWKAVLSLHSRWFGTWSIDDPRPIAADAPYTFHLPSQHLLDAVRPGDLVKAIFRPIPSNRDFDAERMWVKVEARSEGMIFGTLDNCPVDIPQLNPGTNVEFPLWDVIAILWADGHDGPEEPPIREYWDRCMVDDCVASGRSIVAYLYREEPDLGAEDDHFPDSGWRLRGTDQAIAADEAAELEPQYIALGAVLNQDDHWIHLIDSPIGSQFRWNETSGEYVPVSRS